MHQFGQSDYSSFVSVDFIKQPRMRAAFQGSLDPSEIFAQLSLLIPGARFVEGNTLSLPRYVLGTLPTLAKLDKCSPHANPAKARNMLPRLNQFANVATIQNISVEAFGT